MSGRKDIGFTGESGTIIKYAAELLGPGMIAIEKRGSQIFYKPVTMIPNVIELAYYSNSLVPHFALDSIMVTAINTFSKEHERNYPHKVIFKILHEYNFFVSLILYFNFIGIWSN